MKSQQLSVLALLLAFVAVPAAQAASIVVGTHFLLPNTPNQVVEIGATGGEAINGMNFYSAVGDGGPDWEDTNSTQNLKSTSLARERFSGLTTRGSSAERGQPTRTARSLVRVFTPPPTWILPLGRCILTAFSRV